MQVWKSIPVALFLGIFLSFGCNGDDGGGDGGGDTGLVCKDAPASKACDDCKLKAKVGVCEASYQARVVACQGCDPAGPACNAADCAAKTTSHEKCWATAARDLCGGTIGTGTGGSGGGTAGTGGGAGSGGSGGDGGSGGSAGTGGNGGTGSGTGGSGGGTGGAGGGGGTGGEAGPCAGIVCRAGELCHEVDGEPECACTTSPDSCEAYRGVCMDGVCVERPTRISDYEACDDPGAESADGEFICLIVNDAGNASWIRRCSTSSGCPYSTSYCEMAAAPDFGSGLCLLNHCGDSASGLNGTNWGVCDPDRPSASGPLTTEKGACLMMVDFEGQAWMCKHGGSRPIGASCRYDSPRGSSQACTRGSICGVVTYGGSGSCTSNADCDAHQVCNAGACQARGCSTDAQCGPNAYCDGDDGVCARNGVCMATCNAGLGADGSQFGHCPGAGDVCWGGMTATGMHENALGYCAAPGCNLLGGPGQCPSVGGKARSCRYAGWAKGHALMGLCGPAPTAPLRRGQACDAVGPDTCEEGTLCVGSESAGYFCRSYCECSGGDWTSQWTCAGTSTCTGGQTCAWFGAGSKMGVCL